MAGFFDRNATIMLRHGWAQFAADATLFASNVQDLSLTAADISTFHAALCPGGSASHVQIVTAQTSRRQSLYWVVVGQEPETPAETPLGFMASATDDNAMIRSEFEQVTVTVHTPHPDLTRALSIAMASCMVANYDVLHRAGYTGLQFVRGQTLATAEADAPAGGGKVKIYRHSRTWRTRAQAESRTPTGATISDVLAIASDITTVGGLTGGLDPVE